MRVNTHTKNERDTDPATPTERTTAMMINCLFVLLAFVFVVVFAQQRILSDEDFARCTLDGALPSGKLDEIRGVRAVWVVSDLPVITTVVRWFDV